MSEKKDDRFITRPNLLEFADPDLSLRDWFAGQALAGVVVSTNNRSEETYAKRAWALADAMLKEREK